MSVTLITGSGGLIGSAAVERFAREGNLVIGLENDMRRELFGENGSVAETIDDLKEALGDQYVHRSVDIRDRASVEEVVERYGSNISVVVHAAAQPSHDWAASYPRIDYSINALGTFNVLESVRRYAEESVFIYVSTSKVYGTRPNELPLIDHNTRWDLPASHPQYDGITEDFGIDQCLHSLFGASKLSADIQVQEYGRYYEMATGIFRAGCVTGARHAGVEEHGFLSHLVRTIVQGGTYEIFGYSGKQVRDNIHAADLVNAFAAFTNNPTPGEVYNIGGSRENSCSVIEAISSVEKRIPESVNTKYVPRSRKGDHRWYISDYSKFVEDYPDWSPRYDLEEIIEDLVAAELQQHDFAG